MLIVEQNAKAALRSPSSDMCWKAAASCSRACELMEHQDVKEFYLGGGGQSKTRATATCGSIAARGGGGDDGARIDDVTLKFGGIVANKS